MALNGSVHTDGQYLELLPATTIGAAVTGAVGLTKSRLSGMKYLVVEAIFAYGAGGTTAKAWVQTSVDNGVTWIDVMNFAFTTAAASKVSAVTSTIALAPAVTPGDGTLADNTILTGLLGGLLRVKYTTTGTYTGATSLQVTAVAKG